MKELKPVSTTPPAAQTLTAAMLGRGEFNRVFQSSVLQKQSLVFRNVQRMVAAMADPVDTQNLICDLARKGVIVTFDQAAGTAHV